MKRNIIKIDEEKCNGCGVCLPNCPEGAIKLINGKAMLVGELLCDGLGACIGRCPEGAISMEEREAESYDESKVMENLAKQGEAIIQAHLKHLRDHHQNGYSQEAVAFLNNPKGLSMSPFGKPLDDSEMTLPSACPGSRAQQWLRSDSVESTGPAHHSSQLSHWPVQLHLISPASLQYCGKDVILSADCVAYAVADFHQNYLRGKSLAIACPKLDDNQEHYREKIIALIDQAQINTLDVMIMQVPCCRGLLQLAQEAASIARRKVPVKLVVVGVRGDIVQEQWTGGSGQTCQLLSASPIN
jgi:NAD-dependent dihydropyrimidine dehydrogenase PreA subunit